MKRISMILILVFVLQLFGTGITAFAEGTNVVNVDFETEDIFINDKIVKSIVDSGDAKHGKVLKLSPNLAENSATHTHYDANTLNIGSSGYTQYMVSFDAKAGQTDQLYRFMLRGDEGYKSDKEYGDFALIYWDEFGNIVFPLSNGYFTETNVNYNGVDVYSQKYEADKWYNFMLLVDIREKNVSLYIDGECVVEKSTDTKKLDKKFQAKQAFFTTDKNVNQSSPAKDELSPADGNEALYIDNFRIDYSDINSGFEVTQKGDLKTDSDTIELEVAELIKKSSYSGFDNLILTNTETGEIIKLGKATISNTNISIPLTAELKASTEYMLKLPDGIETVTGKKPKSRYVYITAITEETDGIGDILADADFNDGSLNGKNISFEKNANGTGIEVKATNKNGVVEFVSENFTTNINDRRIIKKTLTEPKILYNYFPVTDDLAEMFENINKGSITLKDSNDDGKYDIVLVVDYKNFIVNYFDVKNQVLYNKLNSSDNIECGDLKSMLLYNSAGERMDAEDISVNSALSVARPWKNTYKSAVIYVSNSLLSGTITKTSDDDDTALTIDDKIYRIDKSYQQELKQNYYSDNKCILLGTTVDFILDSFGNICYVFKASDNTGGSLALMLAAKDTGVFQKNVTVKLYTENNEMKTLDLSDSVEVDGIRYRNDHSGILEKINAVDSLPCLILYRTDSAGRINFIDTPDLESGYENAENSLTPVFKDKAQQRFYNSNRLQMKTVLNEKTKVFCIPKNAVNLDESNLYVDGQSKFFISDRTYYADAYYKSTNNAFADAVVYYYETANLLNNYITTNSICIVDSISQGMDSDGDLVNIIYGYDGTKQVTYSIPDDVDVKNLKKGDMIYITFDIKGNPISKADYGSEPVSRVLSVDRLYDETTDMTPGWSTNEYHKNFYELGSADSDYYRTTAMQLVFGYVHKKIDTNVFIGYENGESYDEAAVLTGNVLIYDRSLPIEQRLYLGTIADVVDYNSAGDNCSRIIYATRAAAYRYAIVFK